MAITTEQVKELRDKTGISVMQCRKALEEANGDMEKAMILLKKKGAAIAEKRSDRTLGAGTIAAYVHANLIGAMVELLSETDFVAKNEEFKSLARDIAMQVSATNPEFLTRDQVSPESEAKAREVFAKDLEGKPADMHEKIMSGKLNAHFQDKILLDQPFIKNPDITIRGLIENAIQKFGEKIEVGRFVRFGVMEK
jgi:elongation factor Ts